MKNVAATILLASGLAQAVLETNVDGIDIVIHSTGKNGQELPVQIRELDPQTVAALNRRESRKLPGNIDDSVSSNWCGSAVYNPNDDPTTEFTSVAGTWVVPTISLRSGQSNSDQPSIAQWVGIDGGGDCATGLIQGGTVSQIFSSDGAQHDSAWWEFVPGALVGIDMDVSTGDTLTGTVTTTSPTSGTFVIENQSTGVQVTITIPNGNGTLCGHQADWILEDLTVGGLAPFASFSQTSFTSTSAGTANGVTMDASTGTPIDLAQNGATLCTGSWDGSEVVVVSD